MPEYLTPVTQTVSCATMPIRSFLDLSTAHLSQEDRLFLKFSANPGSLGGWPRWLAPMAGSSTPMTSAAARASLTRCGPSSSRQGIRQMTVRKRIKRSLEVAGGAVVFAVLMWSVLALPRLLSDRDFAVPMLHVREARR